MTDERIVPQLIEAILGAWVEARDKHHGTWNRHLRLAMVASLRAVGSEEPTAAYLELRPEGEEDKPVTLWLTTPDGLVRCFIHRSERPRVQVERTAWINVLDVETSTDAVTFEDGPPHLTTSLKVQFPRLDVTEVHSSEPGSLASFSHELTVRASGR